MKFVIFEHLHTGCHTGEKFKMVGIIEALSRTSAMELYCKNKQREVARFVMFKVSPHRGYYQSSGKDSSWSYCVRTATVEEIAYWIDQVITQVAADLDMPKDYVAALVSKVAGCIDVAELIRAAAEAEEHFTPDELEAHAKKLKEKLSSGN